MAFLAYMYLWLPLLVAWELAWKGVALWKAGRNAHKVWCVCLGIFNTVGILPIIYIFAFSEKKKKR
jgi:uncharacterized membrane protein (DUF485 family)